MQSFKNYCIRLRDAFTIKFIVLLFITQCFLKGIVFVIFTNGVFPLFKDMGIGASQIQLYGALVLSPWTVKPLFGVLSDLVAIGGYHKRWYMLVSIIVGIVGATMMVVEIRVAAIMVIFMTMVHFEIAVVDLLIEGQYAEMMRSHPATGSDIVTLSNGFQQLGFIIAMAFMGSLADLKLFRVSNIIALVLCATPIIPLVFGFLPETKRVRAPVVLVDTLRIRKEWKIIIVVAFTGLAAPAMAAISAYASKELGIICSLVVLTIATIGGFLAFPGNNYIIARVAAYQVAVQISKVSFSTALDFFFTADEACLPGGPGFNYQFYITISGIVGSVAALVTVFIYQIVFSKWNFRSVLLFTTVLSGLSGIFDIILVKRWNITILGIPDIVFFLLGEDVIHSVIECLYWIPSSSIIGKVCPANMESCTYAYLAGISNFGRMVSAITGALLTEWAGISTLNRRNSTSGCNWENLDLLILGGHIIFMMAISIPAAFLIPNVPQDSQLLHVPEVVEPVSEADIMVDDTSDILLI